MRVSPWDQTYRVGAKANWLSLRTAKPRKIRQFFSETSPESWGSKKYLPSLKEPVATVCLSRRDYLSGIVSALSEIRPQVALFHRRTIGPKIFAQAAKHFPEVFPAFVLPSYSDISTYPSMMPGDYVDFVVAAKAHECVLVSEVGSDDFDVFGVKCLRLPPLMSFPSGGFEGRSHSSRVRVLVACEPYPGFRLPELFFQLTNKFLPPIELHLCLGDGPVSELLTYREGLYKLAVTLMGDDSVVVWEQRPRLDFLRTMARDIDFVVNVTTSGFSDVALEAMLLKIPVISPQDVLCTLEPKIVSDAPRLSVRDQCWRDLLCHAQAVKRGEFP
mgnify:CR=1 FL=1